MDSTKSMAVANVTDDQLGITKMIGYKIIDFMLNFEFIEDPTESPFIKSEISKIIKTPDRYRVDGIIRVYNNINQVIDVPIDKFILIQFIE